MNEGFKLNAKYVDYLKNFNCNKLRKIFNNKIPTCPLLILLSCNVFSSLISSSYVFDMNLFQTLTSSFASMLNKHLVFSTASAKWKINC